MAGRHGGNFNPNHHQWSTPTYGWTNAQEYCPSIQPSSSSRAESLSGQRATSSTTTTARHGGQFDPNQHQTTETRTTNQSHGGFHDGALDVADSVSPDSPSATATSEQVDRSPTGRGIELQSLNQGWGSAISRRPLRAAVETLPPQYTGTRPPPTFEQPYQQFPASHTDPRGPSHYAPSYRTTDSGNPYQNHYQISPDYQGDGGSSQEPWKNRVVVNEGPVSMRSQAALLDGYTANDLSAESGKVIDLQHDNKELVTSLKGSRFLFTLRNKWRVKKPNAFQQPGWLYNSTALFSHRDAFGRGSKKPLMDRYLHPMDGRLRKLIVASSDDIYQGPGTSTWRRTYVRNVAPWNVRIATWVTDFHHDPNSWKAYIMMLMRALVANVALQIAFYIKCYKFFTTETARWMFEGQYAPVPIEFSGNAKLWSNNLENRHENRLVPRESEFYRVLEPRTLCFLKESRGVEIRSVADWKEAEGRGQSLSYIFVAYFTHHFDQESVEDMLALSKIAEQAARAAGVAAYWVGASNMGEGVELETDVYRISDVLRGAHSLVIAVGRPSTSQHDMSTDDLLRQWGTRMWTFPEVLLSPGRKITVYTRGIDAPLVLAKNQFAGRVWHDAQRSRALLDHYLGTLTLSKLELAVTALRCLNARETSQYLPGDHAYALMGLLRMRPKIDATDTPFQAFARLSLANDSDKILERLLCMLPNPGYDWHDMTDAYESLPWDIAPYCQVAGLCGDTGNRENPDTDTIILDGAYGATIQWKSFYPVQYLTGFSWKRWLSVQLMENNGMLLSIALYAWFIGQDWSRTGAHVVGFYQVLGDVNNDFYSEAKKFVHNDTISNFLSYMADAFKALPWWVTHFQALCTGVTALFCILYIWTWLYTPQLIKMQYGGKIKGAQPALFGFEGHMNVATIERCIFGGNFGRMKWSVNGSPLSRSYTKEDGGRYGMDPTKDLDVMKKVEKARTAEPGQMRVFTLVDTYNMEVTLFEAAYPPVCLFLCASEGGMQRAIGCSYDWTNQTMQRETVLRMPTPSLNRMDRVSRFKIGIRKMPVPGGIVKVMDH